MAKYKATRNMSVGAPGKDTEYKRGQIVNEIPKGVEKGDFIEIEEVKKAKKAE